MDKEEHVHGNNNKSAAGDNNNSIDDKPISDTSNDINKGMDRYEATIKSAGEEARQQVTLQGLKNKLICNCYYKRSFFYRTY